MTRGRLVALEALLQRSQADPELVGEAMKDREGVRSTPTISRRSTKGY